MTARQVIRASVTARGRGDIGRNIRQTARGAMEVSLAATPRLSSDWTLNSNADISYRWTERPTVRLFNVIPVTIGGEVESALNPQIAMIENGGADAALAGLELKTRMQKFWDAARQPVELDLGPAVDPLYLHLQPRGIAASNLSFANGRGEISLKLFGGTMVTHQGASPWPVREALPNLGTLPGGTSDFRIKVPVRLDWGTVNQLLSSELPITLPLEQPFAGNFTVNSASIQWSDGAFRIVLGVEVAPESPVLSHVSGTFTLRAQPSFDAAEQTLRFDEIALVSSSTPALQAIVSLAQTLRLIEDEVSVPMVDKITGLERDLRRRLISDPVKGINGITRSGNVTVGFNTLQTGPAGLTVIARAQGNLTLTLQVTP